MMLFLLLLIASPAFAADTSIGVGKATHGESHDFQVNYRETIWDNSYLQFKTGWFDGFHAGAGTGLLVDFKPVEMRGGLSVGPTTGQSFLEWNGEAYIGVIDHGGNGIGFQFDHFSKSDREYITLQLSQRF